MFLPVILILSASSVYSANILGFGFFPSFSHQIVFQPIWRELSRRGHKVTVVTTDPINDPSLTNLTEISVRFTYEFMKQTKIQELMSKDANVFQNYDSIFRFIDIIVEAELNSTQFQELIRDEEKHFDLVMFECFHPALYGLSARYKAPVIGLASLGGTGALHDIIGNPTHPYLYPDLLLNIQNKDLTLWQKIQSVAFNLYTRYYHYQIYQPRAHVLAKKYFGEDIPYVGDLEKNMSLLFLNVNPLMYPPRPNVPLVIEMGFMHINPVKPLPEDLKVLLDTAKQGVIYFSLGSNVKSVNIDEKVRRVIIGALGELPYLVLWKWESDHLPGKPKNVITRKWLPQQDVLAHPNIKAFVTQGGLQSTEEAISRCIPLVGLPFMGDQPMNVKKIVELGIGIGLDPTTLTKNDLKKSIIEVAENSKYKNRVKHLRDLAYDRPMTGLEKAIWWTEYVLRHKGARHLRSPTAEISWFHFLLLDVILSLIVVVSGIVFLSYKVAMMSNVQRKEKVI